MSRSLVQLACAFAAGSAMGGALPVRAALVLLALGALLLVAGCAPPARSAPAAFLPAALALGAADAAREGRAYDEAPLRRWAESADRASRGPVRVRGVCRADPRDGDAWVLLVDVAEI